VVDSDKFPTQLTSGKFIWRIKNQQTSVQLFLVKQTANFKNFDTSFQTTTVVEKVEYQQIHRLE